MRGLAYLKDKVGTTGPEYALTSSSKGAVLICRWRVVGKESRRHGFRTIRIYSCRAGIARR